ncbi:UreD urease accessory protein-domain-containing protein [Echria macrotheca]|uniref:UreD urease accessory protein-domain-containing protein n=1 Tax=Echria macrotheca TaxID=438768 RepID=A0AAJ0F8U4_9PEZI|nr:UreD urease accessory protein-domain-containing protein [Echria macrotheca]
MNSPFPKSSSTPGAGRIVAHLLPDGTTSSLSTITYQYPLKLITPSRPAETKSALVFLLSYGGGLVGGDAVDLSIEVRPGARLSIVTQGHTKIFNSVTPDIVTRQGLRVDIAAGAALCLLPDPVQPFAESVYEQTQVFRLAEGASLCMLDWVTQGRKARGEDWSFVRWVGRNEVWTAGAKEKLLVRDAVILDRRQGGRGMGTLREAMHGMGVVGTLLLRGPLVKELGDFFLAEFDALPRLGSRDFRTDEARADDEKKLSPREKWRTGRLAMEKQSRVLWSAANVRGCVVVKFGAPEVEAGRVWIGSMLAYQGSVLEHWGDHALIRVNCQNRSPRLPPQRLTTPLHPTSPNVMPSARQPLMETSDNTATSSPAPTSTARRSGRVSKAPQKFTPDAPPATKRKRAADQDDEDVENESPDEADDADGASADEDPDDSDVEEPKRAPRKKASSQGPKSRKPAAKKPKINGEASAGPDAGALAHLPSRPKKVVRIDIARRDEDGLYADIFASGDSSEKVATNWYHKYREDNIGSITDLVNALLAAAGCDQKITNDDIQDPDNCQNRLADLQNVYAEEGITDYPLISRAKSARPFRELLVGFFKSLITILHETELLYNTPTLMENITRWVASMSSSTLRPFRHTATTVALGMEMALVDVAKKLDDRIAKLTQQLDADKRKKGKNKERLSAVQKSLDEANKNREICQEHISDFFETVFVHRYRDIDPKIRTECVEALGTWIWNLPTVFMEPEYLRYLGWMLSDTVPQTRQEVLKQLTRIFKRDAEKLGHFIDRFRPRLVEMATKDADPSVRVAAISVVQTLKDIGMLEPEELDSVGRSVFDSEIRVRRAVLDFFAGCVNDAIETKVEEMGGEEAVDEIFGEADEDDFLSPRRDWISIKCLAEILASYNAQIEDESRTEPPRSLEVAIDMVQAVAPETRISLAAQVLYEKIDQVKNWEVLAGYLLYDHTTSSKSKSRSKSKGGSNEAILRTHVAPQDGEEPILLEVLVTAAQLSSSPAAELDKSKKRHRPDGAETAEESTVHLVNIIPRLLKKYSAEPSTAVLVLRLVQDLNLDVFQQLRQDSTTYNRLFDEVCTLFERHVDRGVLTAATSALLNSRRYDGLQEITDSKISDLWEVVMNNLRHFDKTYELSVRGNLEEQAIAELGHVLLKMSKLASIANCIDVLEAEAQVEGSEAPAIEILVRTVMRGKLETVDEALDDLEDEAVSFAIKCCQFYFMWKVRMLVGSIQAGTEISVREVDRINSLRKTYEANLIWTLSSRGTNDDLRLFATGGLCDLHVLFATLRQVVQGDGSNQQQQEAAKRKRQYACLEPLFEPISPGLTNELIEIYDAAERAYARCIKKSLNEPTEDEDPIDEDAFSDDDNDDDLSPTERKGKELKAERALCELAAKYVMAIVARMVDCSGPQAGKLKRRMVRNQAKLGNNLREALSYLDEGRLRATNKGKGTAGGGGKRVPSGGGPKDAKGKGKQQQPAKKVLSEEIVVDGDSDDDDEGHGHGDEPEEGTVEDLRRRGLLDEEDEEEEHGGGGGNDNPDRMDEDEESVLGD